MNFYQHLAPHFSAEEIVRLKTALEHEPYKGVFLNTAKVDREAFLHLYPSLTPHPLVEDGFIYQGELDLGKNYLHDAGGYYMQEPSAMVVASLLPLQPGDLVLDLCAAPGGKTIQASRRLGNEGTIIANDIDGKRARALSSNVERLGLGNVIVTNNDFTKLTTFSNRFDKIILDAPCSGSGMFRKTNKMAEDWSYNKVLRLQNEQQILIETAYNMLKPGGLLIYSTCSFSYEENEFIIEHLLSKTDAKLVPIPNFPAFRPSPTRPETIYLLPSHFTGEGHFIALIEKPGVLEATKRPVIASFPLLNYQINLIPFQVGQTLYGVNLPLNQFSRLNVLRAGVKLGEQKPYGFVPDHHLAHYLSQTDSLPLTEMEARAYLHGDVIYYQDKIKNDYYVVSYLGVNLGFVKAVDQQLKNHYPRGLRR